MDVTGDAGHVEPRAAAQRCAWSRSSAPEASVYQALVLGVRDYVNKHRFPGVIMGLSGGVDSALTLAIAVDALGRRPRAGGDDAVALHLADEPRRCAAAGAHAWAWPTARSRSKAMFAATLDALAEQFAGRKPDTTEENIQARCRGLLLMAISNKTGRMLLTTGNKSEMAVGYATLVRRHERRFRAHQGLQQDAGVSPGALPQHGVAGARHSRSACSSANPAPSCGPDQKDTDSLPPYEVLDAILEAFIEEDLSVDEIVARGFDRAVVGRVLDMVKRNEYKRRQSPPGIRVSRRAFGRDWRYPITSGYQR